MSSLLHGFERYPQTPPPTPSEVGMMLASMGDPSMGDPSMGDPSMGDPAAQPDLGLGMGGVPDPTTSTGLLPTEMPVAPSTPIPGTELVRGVDQQTSWIGGTRHLTPDLSNPDAMMWPSAAVAAEDDAKSRGAPWAAQQRRAPTPYNDQQLMKLGLSPYEIRLLKLTGGSK